MLRGEIWIGVWPNDPQKKSRPLLIISNNFRNQALHILDVSVVKLTSLHRRNGSEKPVNIAEDIVHTFKKPTIIRCSAIYTVEKSNLKEKLTELEPEHMLQVNERIKTVLDLV